MSHDANQSKELAKQELSKFEALVSEERKLREKELQERRALVSKKQEMNAELERREKARREAMAAPQQADASRSAGHSITEADIEEEQEKIAACERRTIAPPGRAASMRASTRQLVRERPCEVLW